MTTETNFEAAKLRYHTAHVAFAKIDGQVIDASATLEELREKHAAAADELNAAREGLVQARSPVKAQPEAAQTTDLPPSADATGRYADDWAMNGGKDRAEADLRNGSAVDAEIVRATIEL